MKRYLIIAEDPSVKPVFSDAYDRAKQYAAEMVRDVPEGTAVNIFCHKDRVCLGIPWNSAPVKVTKKKVSKRKAKAVKKVNGSKRVRWTTAEEQRLIKLHKEGHSSAFIAEAMGRSIHSIWSRVHEMGLNPRKPKGEK